MLILLTIFLLLFIPFAMLILHLARPKFSIQGFLVVLAVLAGWPMVLLAKSAVPQTITLLRWQPVSFFPISPALLIDDISWYFALAVMSLALSSIVTSIAQLGQSLKPDLIKNDPKVEVIDVQAHPEVVASFSKPALSIEYTSTSNWQSWAGILIMTSLSLVAVTAGNLLTLLLAWAALDLLELAILLSQVLQSKSRERIILAFTARMAGIGMALLAAIIPWSQGISISFEAINQSTSVYLLVAAGLRLGVLPLHLPYIQQLPHRRGLGTVLCLIPAASSYILLVRIANIGVLGAASPYLLGLTALAGLYAAIHWIIAVDEIDGRPYWLLGTASLAIASAISNQPTACIAWSIASLLSGGLIFSMSMRHKNLIPIASFGFIGLSTLPFSPTWLGMTLYQFVGASSDAIIAPLFYLLSFAFLLIHSLLLTGFIRHIIRGVFYLGEQPAEHTEKWVWFLYPIGLVFILVTHYLIGFLLYPDLNELPLSGWIMGVVALIISVALWYLLRRYLYALPHRDQSNQASPLSIFFSLEWFYRLFWGLFRILARMNALLSTILEGDGGILWALVLFALIFVFLQR
ncbi:MAG: hypothetical protein A2Y53_01475 [Chloroflexi bacterium RBG_16_47_49]|nr:MAG: hypothetical protein A2Y53_01475 [Chloroflexi bacterium RBG_16_47_49]